MIEYIRQSGDIFIFTGIIIGIIVLYRDYYKNKKR